MSKARSPRRTAFTRGTIARAGEQRDDADGRRCGPAPARERRGHACRGAGDGVGERAGDDRRRKQRELGEEAVAARAGQAQQRDGQQVPPAATGQDGRDDDAHRDERGGCVVGPARRDVLLQRTQPGHPPVVRDVAERVHARRRREDQGNERSGAQRRAPGVRGASVEARAQRVERQDQRRQEEARVRVGPDEAARNQRVERARAARFGAFEGEQRQRQAEERHQVRAFDEARLRRPGGQRERRHRGGRRRPAPERHAKQDGHRRRARTPSSAAACRGCRPPGGPARGRSGTARPG